ncbi:hypothetical protein BD413DRAFT_636169 [Trametes elegans]|nr:hypothetical protein BD413DRAFT_636169 [Trametes elegans]
MSRGDRNAATGNLKGSMRDNYTDHGVDQYYKKVGATYRNPHYPGVKNCLFLWLNRWWRLRQPHIDEKKFMVFDMACGSGEATAAVLEWWQAGREVHKHRSSKDDHDGDSDTDRRARPNSSAKARMPPPIAPNMPVPCILAADPYTAQAFHTRTGLYAHPLSFRDVAEGRLPEVASKPVGAPGSASSSPSQTPSPESSIRGYTPSTREDAPVIEMVICSFALHLIEKPSELFALLWELSTKARWLVVLAPHKRPEIKEGWGWCKWDVDTWSECRLTDPVGELLEDRVHCRVYRSLNT